MVHNFGELVRLYKRTIGIPPGAMTQTGMLASQMIREILDREFPVEALH
jgi:hypothetical protein